jgi:hypothetical protein
MAGVIRHKRKGRPSPFYHIEVIKHLGTGRRCARIVFSAPSKAKAEKNFVILLNNPNPHVSAIVLSKDIRFGLAEEPSHRKQRESKGSREER